VDVLPDVASLAMVLSHEWPTLLSPKRGSKYAYNDRVFKMKTHIPTGLRHDDVKQSETRRLLDLLKNYPMRRNWIRRIVPKNVVSIAAKRLPGLLSAHLGNPIAVNGHLRV